MIEDDLDMGKLVSQVLDESGYAEQRAAKMDVDDFLRLLTLFHKVGIHFS